jgi:hypothetical protein
MHRRSRILAYLAILTGLTLTVLLLLALNRDPVTRGFGRPEGKADLWSICPWCEDDRPMGIVDAIGLVLIALVVLSLPAGHMALLIMLAMQMHKPPNFADLKPSFQCPHCNHPLVKQWRVCPYCGRKIEGEQALPPYEGA